MSGLGVRAARMLAVACLIGALPDILSAQVGPNDVALGKSAFQSSDYSAIFSAAFKAVDGNTDGSFGNGSVTATDGFDPVTWWYVDLGASYDITSITLWNRTDCCGNRESNFFVSILASGTPNVSSVTAPTVWQTFNAGAIGVSATYTPPLGTTGQYVKVHQDYANILQLAEVDVEGVPTTTATPEPSSLALLATGLVGGVVIRRRRRQA